MGENINNDLYVALVEHGIFKHNGNKDSVPEDLKANNKALTEKQIKLFDENIKKVLDHLQDTKDTDASTIFDISKIGDAPNKRSNEDKLALFQLICEREGETDLWNSISDSKQFKNRNILMKLTLEKETKEKEGQENNEKREEEGRTKEEEEGREEEEGEEEGEGKREEERKEEEGRKEEGEGKKEEERKNARYPFKKTIRVSGGNQRLYDIDNTNADNDNDWPWHTAATEDGSYTILFEKKSKDPKISKTTYGVQYETSKNGKTYYSRELYSRNELKSSVLAEWEKLKESGFDEISDDGTVNEQDPLGCRLVFYGSERNYSKKVYGEVQKILWIAILDYKTGRSDAMERDPVIECCVLFKNTKYPKMILKSQLATKFLSGVESAHMIHDIIARDNLGPLERHAPLVLRYQNPMSRKHDPMVHKERKTWGDKIALWKANTSQDTNADEKTLQDLREKVMKLEKILKNLRV